MKVWLVSIHVDYESDEVVGVFSSREAADDAAVLERRRYDNSPHVIVGVDEWPVLDRPASEYPNKETQADD